MIWFCLAVIFVAANAIYCIFKILEDVSLGRSRLAVFGMIAGLGAVVPLGWILFLWAVSTMRF